MEIAFISKLKPLLDAIAETMDVYGPRRIAGHDVCERYDPGAGPDPEMNEIRASTPAKEFLLPLREVASAFPQPAEPGQVKPFAIFGLKACDLRSMEILDRVFQEKGFEDPLYVARREKMFTIASDCPSPGESCFCNILGGKPYAENGFDLNVARVTDGYIIQGGSPRGKSFLFSHAKLFGDVPDDLLSERAELRETAMRRLAQGHDSLPVELPLREIVERGYDLDVFDEEARTCVECQACTRVCPTCHCFYLYDTKQRDYFAKMKMWDSCMRVGYAAVAGGANPRKMLGDRLRHRFMHKFVWFLDRYGIEMCVGCGRCIDAETGDVDLRRLLKRLNDVLLDKSQTVVKTEK
jgi:sulfhydrogenase subunit beta (sulfur reductase)